MIDWIYNFIENWKIDAFYVAVAFGLIEFMVLVFNAPELFWLTIDAVIFYSPVWGPLILLAVFWAYWKHYVQRLFRLGQQHIVLELKLPREQLKSPLAMELFFSAINLTGGEPTFIKRNWNGQMRPEFSFEIASIEGAVHFFIYCRAGLKWHVENQLYAQFPDLEITEVPDYTRYIDFNTDTMKMWGIEYKLKKPDPYPLKSYVDYGLDKDPKEEFKIDPITTVIEKLASVGSGEYFWLQFIIRGKKDDYAEDLFYMRKMNKMKRDAQAEIKSLLKAAEDATGKADFNKLTQGQKLAIAGMERSLAKKVFEVGMRGVYFAEKEKFNGTRIGTVITMFSEVSPPDAVEYNAIVPASTRFSIKYDYPWQDVKEYWQKRDTRTLFSLFRKRAYFAAPYKQVASQLTTESLATVYHIPGEVLQSPSVARVPSRRSGAPANLPV